MSRLCRPFFRGTAQSYLFPEHPKSEGRFAATLYLPSLCQIRQPRLHQRHLLRLQKLPPH